MGKYYKSIATMVVMSTMAATVASPVMASELSLPTADLENNQQDQAAVEQAQLLLQKAAYEQEKAAQAAQQAAQAAQQATQEQQVSTEPQTAPEEAASTPDESGETTDGQQETQPTEGQTETPETQAPETTDPTDPTSEQTGEQDAEQTGEPTDADTGEQTEEGAGEGETQPTDGQPAEDQVTEETPQPTQPVQEVEKKTDTATAKAPQSSNNTRTSTKAASMQQTAPSPTVTSVYDGVTIPTANSPAIANVHAGKDFYKTQLKDVYGLTIEENFAKVMEDIEKEYRMFHPVTATDSTIYNWSDVIAIYLLNLQRDGAMSFTLDEKADKEALSEIFAELNPIIQTKEESEEFKVEVDVTNYASHHIDTYIAKHTELTEEEKTFLAKYEENNYKILAASACSAPGLVYSSVGEDISPERRDVIVAAYSLLGKVHYFWGGKSFKIGWDDNFGTAQVVDAAGSRSTGQVRTYGLDCSGYVTWAFINGYQDVREGLRVGSGTAGQWASSLAIQDPTTVEAGDLVFLQPPTIASINHVGIVVGRNNDGDVIAIHCNASDNGVVVQEASSAGFRYARTPICLEEEKEETQGTEQVARVKKVTLFGL